MFDLVDYIFAFFLAAVPAQHHAHYEPAEQTLGRYQAIAEDIAAVVSEPAIEPLFDGRDARAKTAVLLASVAASESYLRADVDNCKVRGDGGKSATIFQIQNAPKSVCTDRRDAVRVALERLRASMSACKTLPASERLAQYASGRCDRGQRASRYRWQRAERWIATHPVIDADELEMY